MPISGIRRSGVFILAVLLVGFPTLSLAEDGAVPVEESPEPEVAEASEASPAPTQDEAPVEQPGSGAEVAAVEQPVPGEDESVEETPEEQPEEESRGRFPEQDWPLVLVVQSESMMYYPTSANLSMALGTELFLVDRSWFELRGSIDLSYLYHRYLAHGPHIDVGLITRFVAPFGLYGDLNLRVGVNWFFYPGVTYHLGDDGEFEEGGNTGFASFRAGTAVILGFDFGRRTRVPLKIFARYEIVFLIPYLPKAGIPYMGQTFVGAGMAIAIDPSAWRR